MRGGGKQVNDKRVTAKKTERLNIGAKYIFLKNSIKIPLRKGRDLNNNICAFLNATFLRRFEY